MDFHFVLVNLIEGRRKKICALISIKAKSTSILWAQSSNLYYNTGQSIPIPHSKPFSHLRNGSQTYLNIYIYLHITSDLIELYISKK